ncbi:tetratricopeptide repeat protein [Geothrix sp. PMB-07]|uniref:tetratricopeptide repeat protein n=1 Tax=Geothrix sp. PMB-07 TaxID=3068640 RepID=UPI0027419641|nr:tetratricopeptide repeat protein [Geothrix sp. PMB-07]WLT32570.1 tetratricopeptide repeat protein [Geothrix sp. PMB-07]
MRLRMLALLFGAALLVAGEDPFEAPPELRAFARQHTISQQGAPSKVAALVKAFFAPQEEGGLGIIYDNAYTRTPLEAWRDRKANCLTLTTLYVAACKSIDLDARYGESLRISRWRRVGTTVRYERHIVAVVSAGVGQEFIADFLPEVRRESQLIAILEPKRVLALFHSNRAVELLAEVRTDEALANAKQSIQVDPSLGVGWNILGVVQRSQGFEVEAEKSFLKALQADPKDGAPCGNLENLLRAQGRMAEAQVYRDRGLEIRKKDPYFNAFLAEEAFQDSQWEEAEKRIKQAIKLMPQESDFYLIQARINLAQGQRKEAIKSLEKARKWALPDMQARYDTKLALLKGDIPA